NVFVEEPIHFVAPNSLHFRGHMLLDHGFEVLGGCCTATVCLAEIVHHVLEVLVGGLIVPHHHSQHVQDVCAFGIDQPACEVEASPAIAHAVSHRERASINGTEALLVTL